METDREVPPRLLSVRAFLEATVAAVLALGLCVPVFGAFWVWLDSSWGASDTLPAYVEGQSWDIFRFENSTQYGFPLGLDFNYYPTLDPIPNTLIQLVSLFTDSPFLASNLLIIAAFPLLAFASVFLFRIVGLTGPLAVTGAAVFAVIPFHFERSIIHPYLGFQFAVVAGMALVLLVGTGRFEQLIIGIREKRYSTGGKVLRFALLFSLILVAAGNGVYYVFFNVLLGLGVLIWRLSRSVKFRLLMLDAVPFALVGLVGAIGLAAVILPIEAPVLVEPAKRSPEESLIWAGSLAMLLVPLPSAVTFTPLAAYHQQIFEVVSQGGRGGPILGQGGLEGTTIGSAGTVVTSASLVVLVLGFLWAVRKSAGRETKKSKQETVGGSLSLILFLVVFLIPWFIPAGLNWLFAVVVTPQLRTWNRLTPYLLLLFLLGAAAVLAKWQPSRRLAVALPLSALVLVVTLAESVLPFRPGFQWRIGGDDSDLNFGQRLNLPGTALTQGARDYADQVNRSIPQRCGVLQLPYVPFPEVTLGAMDYYDHLWPALTNLDKHWSYGAMKGTYASVWASQLPLLPNETHVRLLKGGDFCGIHVDLRAWDEATSESVMTELTRRFGPPVATALDANWQFFAIGNGASSSPEEAESFFNQAYIEVDGATVYPQESSLDEIWWWTSSPNSTFTLRGTRDQYPVTRVKGVVSSSPCGSREVEVSLEGGSEQVSQVIMVGSEKGKPFELELPEPASSARLTFAAGGEPCVPSGDSRALFVKVQEFQPW